MIVGNDIVDLELAGEPSPRFVARVLAPEERRASTRAADVWRRWAAKEAAFKALARRDPGLPFVHARFVVDLEAGLVAHPRGEVRVRWERARRSARLRRLAGRRRLPCRRGDGRGGGGRRPAAQVLRPREAGGVTGRMSIAGPAARQAPALRPPGLRLDRSRNPATRRRPSRGLARRQACSRGRDQPGPRRTLRGLRDRPAARRNLA